MGHEGSRSALQERRNHCLLILWESAKFFEISTLYMKEITTLLDFYKSTTIAGKECFYLKETVTTYLIRS
jgi:hypothetical protein